MGATTEAPPRLVNPRAHHVTVDGQATVKRHHAGCGVDHPFYSECMSLGGSKLGVPRPRAVFTEGTLMVDEVVSVVGTPAPVSSARVAVGGTLHGQVVSVPVTATHVIKARHAVRIDATEEAPFWQAVEGVEIYLVRNRGMVRLIIESEVNASGERAGKSNRLGETIVEALGIASGSWGASGPLVKTLPPPDFDD